MEGVELGRERARDVKRLLLLLLLALEHVLALAAGARDRVSGANSTVSILIPPLLVLVLELVLKTLSPPFMHLFLLLSLLLLLLHIFFLLLHILLLDLFLLLLRGIPGHGARDEAVAQQQRGLRVRVAEEMTSTLLGHAGARRRRRGRAAGAAAGELHLRAHVSA